MSALRLLAARSTGPRMAMRSAVRPGLLRPFTQRIGGGFGLRVMQPRLFSGSSEQHRPGMMFSAKEIDQRNKNGALYLISFCIGMVGMSYLAVPLYQIFCQKFGLAGTTQVDSKLEKLNAWRASDDKTEERREVEISFTCSTNFDMPWDFKPTQRNLRIIVGETALAFFTATNTSTEPVVGVATYNVTPMRAGLYFNKIQCFCFDEQRLRAGESVDMPVFFYLDPEMLNDPKMEGCEEITLAYTFFPSDMCDEEYEDPDEVKAKLRIQLDGPAPITKEEDVATFKVMTTQV